MNARLLFLVGIVVLLGCAVRQPDPWRDRIRACGTVIDPCNRGSAW